ncbi:cell surface protein [Grosmannia clavigera kw1407]|uniref:Cell surface protein n=1 Tax=Grosmannia clavigera (strain kw1407 / UAMH 11150) TaxID=655863 RepID=F0XBL2_GROCL|nr:cell surface protein [Grosmannia clavigera kw1407]EFX04998.1 cell surface protein [Grosmannia clavigera kw1407]
MEETSAKTWLVMPLYIYPLTESTWGALYDVIIGYPDLNFLVIVNPNSGPGDADLPGHDYVREVPKLNSYPNVCTVGYVRVGWCRRTLEETFEDIRTYADWKRDDIPGFYVEGIYLDETPNHVAPERAQHLHALRQYIKNAEGLVGDRLVVHNPGTPPEGHLKHFGSPDMVCLCEEPYKMYGDDGVQRRLRDYALPWHQTIYQISGIPAELMDDVVQELCQRAKYVFATDLVDDFYESFSPSWAGFAAAVNRSNQLQARAACS